MSEPTWLRDALRRATAAQPDGGDRAAAAFRFAARRRRQRLVAASCTAAVAVLAATLTVGGGTATSGLQPAAPTTAPTTARTETPAATASPEGSPTPTPTPTIPAEAPSPSPTTAPPAPAAPSDSAPASPSPAGPPAFDVYFLVDATGSMHPQAAAVSAAVADVVERLGEVTRLRHGYAIFRDILNLGEENPVYERLTAVRADGGRLPDVTYGGGGADPREAHTIALRSAIGHADKPYTDGKEPAGFGDDVTRIVVLVTDAPVNSADEYPTIDETVADLNAAGVAVATLVLPPPPEVDAEEVRRDMAAFAEGTGAVAARDADCDGDGRTDLRRGDPIVCDVTGPGRYAGFADALFARFRTGS